ncbi:helix-turn-helix domain-containing protein [bacterium]|nr:helix-turn-helix domain-containing protein [bacterium]
MPKEIKPDRKVIEDLPTLTMGKKNYVLAKDLAGAFGCSLRTITRYVKSKKLKCIKFGGSKFVLLDSVEKFLDSQLKS